MLKLLLFFIDHNLVFLLWIISRNCWAKTLHRLLCPALLIQTVAMDRAMRDKVMMLLFLISNGLWPFDHGLLFLYGSFGWLLESHLHRLIPHRIRVDCSDTAPRPGLPNRSLLHLHYVLQTCLDRFWFSYDCLVLSIVWVLLRSERLLVLIMMIWWHNTCTSENYLTTLWCCILFVRFALSILPLMCHFLA